MQTNFGCCLIDGKIVESKSAKLKVKNEKLKSQKRNAGKSKKVINQSKVEFE
ncbi:lipid-A-disaccharide synthase [Nautilia sp. PV-1]|jgi:hypothetical protein|uniref:lipid-A-disaccharide synthase n=1 Tax=Nautilia sp. PV-1 TaxID=2579250 RepID=UPI001FEE5D8E|nr:lipid-A-disaccharide synthase [Nautilia sp. PV-1]